MDKAIRPLREGFQPDEQPKVTEPTSTEPAEPDLVEVWPIVVPLRHGAITDPTKGEIRELRLRHPTGGDLNRIGLPLKMSDDFRFVIDERKMHQMIGALSGTLTPILDQIDPRDWHACAWKLYRFFLPSSGAWD